MQIQALKDYGVPENLIFVDRASAGTFDRPQFIEAMKYALGTNREFVVWKLDRLGCTLEGIPEVLKKFDQHIWPSSALPSGSM